jgi:hypothetical protein
MAMDRSLVYLLHERHAVRLHRDGQSTCQRARLEQPTQTEEIAERMALNE